MTNHPFETDGELLAHMGQDAREWAIAFLRHTNLENAGPDFTGSVIAWFANALGAGETGGYNKTMGEIHQAAKELGVDLTDVYTPSHAVNVVHGHWQATFAEAQDLEDYLFQLEDAGKECQVPILDSNGILWTTYGEERTSGGEACIHWLSQGDPVEHIEHGGAGDDRYVPIPLDRPKYPVRLLYRPDLAQ